MKRAPIVLALMAGFAAFTGCSDKSGVTDPPAPASVQVILPAALRVGASAMATANVRDRNGNPMTGQQLTWQSTDQSIAAVDNTGRVTALAPGNVDVRATARGISGSASLIVSAVPIISVDLTPGSFIVEVGETRQFTAIVKDSANNPLPGRPIAWSVSDTSRAIITATGLLTARSEGAVTVSARIESLSSSVTGSVVAAGLRDIAIENAQWTQGVQAADGSIPLVDDAGAAVVNVVLSSTHPSSRATKLTLRLFDSNSVMYRLDTTTVVVPPGNTASLDRPSIQLLLPAAAIRPGMKWQLLRDAGAIDRDASSDNDVFPRGVPATLPTAVVPPLKIRFVPVTLTAHGNVTGRVTDSMLEEYLRTLRSVLPIGSIQVSIAPAHFSDAVFGTPPSGGQAAFWQQVLREIDTARILDPANADQHWIGVVAPPAGFNFTAFGGFGYVPSSGAATGPSTRTSVLVNVGWFNNPTQSRDLVAHELGHNFGRAHAPCGAAGNPDAAFPHPGGTIGRAGYDVYSWSSGRTQSANTVAATTGDVMGYCFPVWSSEYTYRGILNFRGSASASFAARIAAPVRRHLLIQGDIRADVIEVLPHHVVETNAVPPDVGDYVVEGFATDGSLLFAQHFAPGRYDHDDEVKPFAVYVPVEPNQEQRLARVRVRPLN